MNEIAPFELTQAATKISTWFKERNIKEWRVGEVKSANSTTALERLIKYIQTVDVSRVDTPIGVVLSTSGLPYITWSLSSAQKVSSLEELLSEIDSFLAKKGAV